MFIWFIIIPVVLVFIVGFVNGLKTKPPDETTETTETDELNDIHKQERIEILDNTLVQYIKLLDSLALQLREETNEKKRSALLAKQIIILEKYNRALEKREKLE